VGFGFEDVADAEVDEGGRERLLDWCAVVLLDECIERVNA